MTTTTTMTVNSGCHRNRFFFILRLDNHNNIDTNDFVHIICPIRPSLMTSPVSLGSTDRAVGSGVGTRTACLG